jgi:glutathione transport system substrate-binding protein
VEGKGQKESGVRMFYTGWSASTGEADWALSPLFASQNWPPTLFNTAFTAIRRWIKTWRRAENHRSAGKTRLYKERRILSGKSRRGCRWWWRNWSQRTAKI